ncbi:ABC transporter ATP-binding protein [Alloscardovia theropitheci]|uniref:ABC transporter ATP-binding protein n=1 Tax=Alloscardovia theropitheci TaxID=2496842 RepID=A0A4R0QXL6_9BIFI|nr:ABC transporter ATP-binding protein [Alloscardovia theropitheci]TCD54211.1 ABC transporter ATP-binding protein [Alloscardovia theropitheci]
MTQWQIDWTLNKKKFSILVLLTITLAILMTADALLLQAIISAVQNAQWKNFWILTCVIIIYLPARTIVYYVRQARAEEYSNLLTRSLRERLFATLSDISLSQFSAQNPDSYLTNLTVHIDSIKSNIIDVVLRGFYLCCLLISAVTISLFINPILGIVAIVLSVPLALSPIISKKIVECARAKLVHSTNRLSVSIADLLHGLVDWRSYHAQASINRQFSSLNDDWLQAANHDARVQKSIESINNMLSHTLYFGIWIVGGILIFHSQISLAQIVAFASLSWSISEPLFYASGLFALYHAGQETIRQVSSLFAFSDDTQHSTTSESSSSHIVIDPHTKYLMIGKSGAGKSTLAKELLGISNRGKYDITTLSDGLLTNQATHIGYISQSSHIFHASIRDNITLFDDSLSDADVLRACEKAHILEWVNARGIDYELDNDLTKLSGGEKQRILLARFFIHNPQFGILDEITAGLDIATVTQVERTLSQELEGYIYISHRLDSGILHFVDQVIVVDNLRIVAIDTPEKVRPYISELNEQQISA